jgi:hypothetical protein
MVWGLVACILALAGGVASAQPGAAWPPHWPRVDTFTTPGNGDSPRRCATLAGEARRRLEERPLTEADVYRGMGDAFGAMAAIRLAAFVPTAGLHLQRGSRVPGLAISWPASIPLGPVTACRVSPGSGDLHEFRALRLVLEPALVVRRPLSVFLRPGLRALWHRSTWRVGFGAGVGSTLAWIDGDRVAASISPELSVHVGRCCAPGYLLINFRADRYYPRREPDTALANIGFAFW